MTNPRLSIGQLARESGCKVQTIRWYEEIGLMPEPARTPGNQRIYGREHADRLAFIRHARELGFPLDDVREMLAMGNQPGESCDAVDSVARRHLRQVKGRIQRLKGLEAELERMVEQCRGGKVADCRIIEVLSDHSHAQCLSDEHDGKATRGD
ncbi:MAG: helix-turn-helix domain-containing protein [Gammaproteobacteria bacterium]|nr:helix-turn-helix domain-containing protein [Gammaproteobacteria bacterium]MDH3412972.1 helix-turn-helix domain-containing protein [Gammaproteobacteria bacterium]